MEEKVYFPNSKGDKLCGILSNPTGKRDFVVILCHGFSSNKGGKTYTSLVPILNKNNIASFRFDFFGHGESEGKFEDITISEAADDIRQAMKFVSSRGYEKLILMGTSFGGFASILAASKPFADLTALILRSPVSDYLEVVVRKYGENGMNEWKQKGSIQYKGIERLLAYSFVENFMQYDIYEVAQQIKAPTLIIHGDKDKNIPLRQSQKLAKQIPKARLEVISGADHFYSNPEHFQKMLDLVVQFILKHAAAD